MKTLRIFAMAAFALPAIAQNPKPAPGCIAVKSLGSHAFRNIMLGGIAGALMSKEQYQVVDVVSYPAHTGQKFHGNDLQAIQASGTKVVILAKHYTGEDLRKACQYQPNGASPKSD